MSIKEDLIKNIKDIIPSNFINIDENITELDKIINESVIDIELNNGVKLDKARNIAYLICKNDILKYIGEINKEINIEYQKIMGKCGGVDQTYYEYDDDKKSFTKTNATGCSYILYAIHELIDIIINITKDINQDKFLNPIDRILIKLDIDNISDTKKYLVNFYNQYRKNIKSTVENIKPSRNYTKYIIAIIFIVILLILILYIVHIKIPNPVSKYLLDQVNQFKL